MRARQVVFRGEVGEGDFAWLAGGGVGREGDADERVRSGRIIWRNGMNATLVEEVPGIDLLRGGRGGEDVDVFLSGERAQGFAVAVVGFVLADDDQVEGLIEVGEGGDLRRVDVLGVLEGGVEDGAAAGEPWVDQDGESAVGAVGVVWW